MLFEDLCLRSICLTDERLHHIENDHPEMRGQIEKVRETLTKPDVIVRSKTDIDVELFYRLYRSTPVTEKYLCIVLKTRDKDTFMVTAYFTDTVKKGETLWPKR